MLTRKPVRKGRWIRRSLRVILVVVILFIAGCFIVDHYMQFRKDDEELMKIFSENRIPAHLGYYTTQGRQLRYVEVEKDSPSRATLLFLHGSPGSMSFYGRRFQDTSILNRFRIISLDRPGYGYSGFGDPEASIETQAKLIRPLIDSIHNVQHPLIIVGSSYGASIACRLAMDYPQLVDGLVLTGPSLGPGLEKYFWFTPIIESPVMRWCIPRLFRSANTEKYHHKGELEKMLPLWKNLRIPVVYLQGVNDNLIDTANAGFARREMSNVPYLNIQFIQGREHRLAQYEWPAFKKAIMEVYDKVAR